MPSPKKPAAKPKGKAPAKSKGGRPPFKFDLAVVKALAQVQCTDEEMAAALGCSHDTLERARKKDPKLAEAIEHGRATGRASLRRVQFKAALGGNATMQIWLGKQLLGQKDKQEVDNTSSDGSLRGGASSVVVYIPDNGRDK